MNTTSNPDNDFYYSYSCDSVSTIIYENSWINSETFPREHTIWYYPEYIKKLYEKILKEYMDKVTKIILRKYRVDLTFKNLFRF